MYPGERLETPCHASRRRPCRTTPRGPALLLRHSRRLGVNPARLRLREPAPSPRRTRRRASNLDLPAESEHIGDVAAGGGVETSLGGGAGALVIRCDRKPLVAPERLKEVPQVRDPHLDVARRRPGHAPADQV